MNVFDKVFKDVEPIDPANPITPPETGGDTKSVLPEPSPELEPPAPEKSAEPTPAPPPPPTKYEVLSQTLGREFKSDDDIEAWRTEQAATLQTYEEKLAAIQSERDTLAQSFNPKELFASDEIYYLNGLLKKFPGKNHVALTEIATRDLSKIAIDNPMDVLALNKMLDHPGIYTNKDAAIEDVLADYNLPDMDDVDEKTLRRMKVAASEAATKFGELKSQIEAPKNIDLTAEVQAKNQAETQRIQKMTEATEKLFAKEIPETLKALEFPVQIKSDDGTEVTEIAFKYDIGESFAKSKQVQDILATIRESEIRTASEFTPKRAEQLKKEVSELLAATYMYQHRAEVYMAIRNDLSTKFQDEQWMKRHNVRPLRQDGTTPRTDPEKAKFERQQLDAIGSVIGRKL